MGEPVPVPTETNEAEEAFHCINCSELFVAPVKSRRRYCDNCMAAREETRHCAACSELFTALVRSRRRYCAACWAARMVAKDRPDPGGRPRTREESAEW